MSMHWVVIGDAAGAKVYESDALLEELTLVDHMTLVHAHVHHEGGHAGSNGHLPGAGRSAEAAEHDPQKVTSERFARAIAKAVNDAEGQHRFERLVVAAPPRFLGEIREALSHGSGKRLVASFHHDWTHLSPRELSAQLRKSLPATAGMP